VKYRDVPIPVVFLSETRAHGHVVVEHHLPVASPHARRSRRGGAAGAGHAPGARTLLRPSTRQAGKPTTAASSHQAGTSGNKRDELLINSLPPVQVRWLRPSGGRYCPTRGPWAVPPVSDPVSFPGARVAPPVSDPVSFPGARVAPPVLVRHISAPRRPPAHLTSSSSDSPTTRSSNSPTGKALLSSSTAQGIRPSFLA
jgi:hypothetical protein